MVKGDIKLVVYDFDGVMTDNRVFVNQDGIESVVCNRGDGLGVSMVKGMLIPQIILSTETNDVVLQRAKKLGIPAIHGSGDKLQSLSSYCLEKEIRLADVLYVGNDLNDFEVMGQVGLPVCPADAHEKIRKLSSYVTTARGGEGVVRELAEWLSIKTDE
jgi:N-acylneuraminate cytidylyltransferase/3-deoxy-D-manno-octulosonate 8-phosphate phosphatase (KDO 8-P phosphatase)